MYYTKDVARGLDGTFMWFMEEVGELASSLRHGTHEERLGEFADVLAWLATMATWQASTSRKRSISSTAAVVRLRQVRMHLPQQRKALTTNSRSACDKYSERFPILSDRQRTNGCDVGMPKQPAPSTSLSTAHIW